MPAPSRVALLPEALRDELERWIAAHGFAGYEVAAAWLAERARAMGLDQATLPKRSALQDYGSKLKRKLEAIAASTKAAQTLADLFPDDADLRSAATIALAQTEFFNLLVALQEIKDAEPDERLKLLSRVAQAISELSRASVNQKKWQQSVRAKAEAAAERVGQIAKKGGLSTETAAQIRRLILGIAE